MLVRCLPLLQLPRYTAFPSNRSRVPPSGGPCQQIESLPSDATFSRSARGICATRQGWQVAIIKLNDALAKSVRLARRERIAKAGD